LLGHGGRRAGSCICVEYVYMTIYVYTRIQGLAWWLPICACNAREWRAGQRDVCVCRLAGFQERRANNTSWFVQVGMYAYVLA
jgi:hypothetical protein